MKRLIYLLAVYAAAFAFQGCGDGTKNSNDNADSSKVMTDSLIDESSPVDGQMDTDFANKAAISGMAEVEFGRLALATSTHAKVKDFASMMVSDHGKANQELKDIAMAKNITLPTTLDAEHMQKKEELQAKTGSEFDKAYVAAMVEGHQKTLDLMTDEAANGNDPELKAFAAKTAPVVKAHLDLINKIQAELK